MLTFFPEISGRVMYVSWNIFRNGSLKVFFFSFIKFHYTEFLERTENFDSLKEETVPNSAKYVLQNTSQCRNGGEDVHSHKK